jgi:hypothetical protein
MKIIAVAALAAAAVLVGGPIAAQQPDFSKVEIKRTEAL